jgi:hypothetical protein
MGWGTAAPNAKYWVSYVLNGEFAEAKPEGALQDGTENGSFTSYNHNIYLDVPSQHLTYSFYAQNTSSQYLSFMLCGAA